MHQKLTHIEIHNFRSLENVRVRTNALNVLFGPNGSGKSTFFDAIWFVRDCAIRGVDMASSYRNHGIGSKWDRAGKGENISIQLETDLVQYEVMFGYSSGRIEPFVGEKLYSKEEKRDLLKRKVGSHKADFYHQDMEKNLSTELREPERLAFIRYLNLEGKISNAVLTLDELLKHVHFYYSRKANLRVLKKRGSESSHYTWLGENSENLWSVLRNLHDRENIDEQYRIIIQFMREGVPDFNDLLIEQTGPTSVYGNFIEKGRRQPIRASEISDGHIQLLILLTALFAEGKDRPSLIIFDEPEISLHPHALAVFAKAVKLAAQEWNKQVFIATHSPVLISQFSLENILVTTKGERGETIINRVSEMDEIQDLLEEYAVGSLYMAEMLASQSDLKITEVTG